MWGVVFGFLFSLMSFNTVWAQPTPNDVVISGGVKSPGLFKYEKGLTALNAIILAGGFTEAAKPALSTIMRKESDKLKAKAIAVNLKNILRGLDDDLPLRPGDQLIVPQ